MAPQNDRAGTPLLEVREVSRHFSGIRALDGMSLQVWPGTIHGLIGPNGAGKTTLVNLLTGFYRATSGQIMLDGRRLDGRPPHQIARLGVARTFQNIRLFATLSALDNVLVARRGHTMARSLGRLAFLPGATSAEQDERERARELLERVGILAHAGRLAGTLSYGDQRRVELARALATEPRLLLLDEPAAGMNHEETDRLAATLRGLVTPSRAIVLIEHDLRLIMSVCDMITVLNFGQVIAEGPPDAVASDSAVIEAYLGRDDDAAVAL